jgi:hypothetical protein
MGKIKPIGFLGLGSTAGQGRDIADGFVSYEILAAGGFTS